MLYKASGDLMTILVHYQDSIKS